MRRVRAHAARQGQLYAFVKARMDETYIVGVSSSMSYGSRLSLHLETALCPSQCRGSLLRRFVVRMGRETDEDEPAPSFTMA